jgi:hypothetical protein
VIALSAIPVYLANRLTQETPGAIGAPAAGGR